MSDKAEDNSAVLIEDVVIQKDKEGRFLIAAKGTTPTGEWQASLKPVRYTTEPEDWLIVAVATSAHGIKHNKMVTEWKASKELALPPSTKKITVKGANSMTVGVPH